MKKGMMSALGMYAYAMMLSSMGSSNHYISDSDVIDNIKKPARFVPSKGMKKFNINGKEVWAINEKNAIRKAGKL